MRKKYNLEIKQEAVAEIEDAYYYYEEQQAGLGDIFLKFLDKCLKSMMNSSSGFKKVSGERRQIAVRKFPFVVIYEVFDNTIVVFAVFHTRRNPNDKMRLE